MSVQYHDYTVNRNRLRQTEQKASNGKKYIVTKEEKEETNIAKGKEDLPLPWIKCLWCDYRIKIERDLEYHFLEKHKGRLYQMKISPDERKKDTVWIRDPFSWMYDEVEYRLYKATKLSKKSMSDLENRRVRWLIK